MHDTRIPRSLAALAAGLAAAVAAAAPAGASEGPAKPPPPWAMTPPVFQQPGAGAAPSASAHARPRIRSARIVPRRVRRGHRATLRLTLSRAGRVRVTITRVSRPHRGAGRAADRRHARRPRVGPPAAAPARPRARRRALPRERRGRGRGRRALAHGAPVLRRPVRAPLRHARVMAPSRVRQLLLQVATGVATVALLAALTAPAVRTLRAVADAPVAAEPARALAPAPHPRRVFGIYVDPWHAADWARAVGAAPQALATFEAFSRRRTLTRFTGEAARRGIRRILVSWEPWQPVPSALGVAAQARQQPGMRNIDIARGAQDRYIARFARTLARFPGTVQLRFAHEMNGYWYPWSRDPAAYRLAFRRVVRIFRAVGARNVRFVWSVNANLYEPAGTWRAALRRYWPGRRYVDLIGTTVINFGGAKHYDVARFEPRLEELHRRYRRPVVLTETNTAADGAALWLRSLRGMLARMPWVRGVYWSQLPSRGKAQQPNVGTLDWDVRRDPASSAELAALIREGAALARLAHVPEHREDAAVLGRRSARWRACGRCWSRASRPRPRRPRGPRRCRGWTCPRPSPAARRARAG